VAKEKAAIMGHPRFSTEEIGQRGQELYDKSIRAQIETEENLGKLVVIDIETGDYEIDSDGLAAGDRLLAKHPEAALYALRIGYDAVYTFGGALTQVKQ
jgi:hypothetical protein